MGIPKGLVRCGQCGEPRGRRIKCLCEGIVCRYCKKNAIHRPISDYYDEATKTVYHVAWYGYLVPCFECRRARTAERAHRQKRKDG